MPLNIKLFERIKAHLREEPRRADMHYGLLSVELVEVICEAIDRFIADPEGF